MFCQSVSTSSLRRGMWSFCLLFVVFLFDPVQGWSVRHHVMVPIAGRLASSSRVFSTRMANEKLKLRWLRIRGCRENLSGMQSLQSTETPIEAGTELENLKEENEDLRDRVRRLEQENQLLRQRTGGGAAKIVLESFEGSDAKGQNGWFGSDSLALPEADGVTLTGAELESSLWCDELEEGTCPVEPTVSFIDALKDRATWLVGLLAVQSCSGFILSRNEALLENHPVIIYFLTMLVGAGGNAGNQASVRVIRGLALGTLNDATQTQFLWRELKMAGALCSILSMAGFLRASVFQTPLPETVAVTSSLALIVFSSICLGAVLPLILKKIGVDPAHSSTTIQVVMDILGVLLTVVVSSAMLDSPLGQFVIGKLVGT